MTEPTEQDDSEQVAHCWRRRWDAMYRVRVSVLYHLKRERFFDRLDKYSSMATALAATSAVAVLLKSTGSSPEAWAAGVTAALSLVPLVFNPADKARKHATVASEFRRLLAECERMGEHWSAEQCNQIAAKVLELEATEPAPLCALVIDCQNQLNVATGREQDRVPLRFHERWLKQWVDFDAQSIASRHRKNLAANH